uniref:Retrotransposon protein, putative, Ty3-gypsy subclass n=2 Tax=Oryza sativa subsp. japonica TaxID=39947 RepID=Q7G6I0_ORYSJ|nr:Hypothetical protein with similarity to putative retroelement [Oryza sativa Japonica Group]AAM08888.1 Hypothetical protein with similarity to putative retroelement [Oryza sativa Japonica Group]
MRSLYHSVSQTRPEIYSKIIPSELASNHTDEIPSTPTRPDQDDAAYPPILMKLPDDLAAVFTTRASSSRRSRGDPALAPIQSSFRESASYFSLSDGFNRRAGWLPHLSYNLDDFDKSYEDNYTPLFFGVFMADNETAEQRQAREAEEQRMRQEAERHRLEEERQAQERYRLQRQQQECERAAKEAEDRRQHTLEAGRQARELIEQQDVEGTVVFRTPQQNALATITLLDTLLHKDAPNHVPVNSASVRTPTGSRVPPLRSQDYHQPSLSVAASGSNRRSRDHDERSVHSSADRHRERRAEQPSSPRHRYDDDEARVAAFTSDLRRVDWPAGFKPTRIEKYDGKTKPESWLTVYGLAICAVGGDSTAMANYLPLHMLPHGTIRSSAELHKHFITNFQGTFDRPGTQFDLYNVIQKPGESLWDYIRCFSEQRNKISDITDNIIIAAFTMGVRHELLVGKFRRKHPRTVKQMFQKANEYAKADDAVIVSKQSGSNWKPKKDAPAAEGSGTPSSRQRPCINTFDKIMNAQCSHHPNSNHAVKDCIIYQQFTEQYAKKAWKPADGEQSTSKKKDNEDDGPTGFLDSRKELNHIFGGPQAYESKRKQKLTDQEINAVQPDTPQYLQWSETTIKFDRSDHLDRVVHPWRYPLVLDPVIRNVKLRQSLIDGVHSIFFLPKLDDMQIPRTELKPSSAPFHGVIPGLSSTPLVANFETAYHAILGRPTLAKFMAVPHYTYVMMKMPGPRGVISLRSDIKQAVTCDKESCEMAQTREITLARDEIRLAASTATEGEVPAPKISKTGEINTKTKKITLDPSDPSKTAVIGAELDCK